MRDAENRNSLKCKTDKIRKMNEVKIVELHLYYCCYYCCIYDYTCHTNSFAVATLFEIRCSEFGCPI